MDMTIRPMTTDERKFSYSQDKETMQLSGCIGHLRGDMDSNGQGFFTSWNDHQKELKTQAFKAEFDDVVNALRFDEEYGGLLKNRSSLTSYCYKNPDSGFDGNYTKEFGFRADTDDYSYMIRCNPNKGDYNFYIYAYEREALDRVLNPAPERINVLVVEPGEMPYPKEIHSGLSSLQKEVGGDIQAVYPFEEPVALICDEEAKLKGKELNRTLRDDEGHIYDVVAGTFLITGLGREDFSSLTPEQIKKFTEHYKTPEMFIKMDGKLVVLPMETKKVKSKKPSVLQKLNDMKATDAPSAVKKPHVKEER